MTEQQSSEGKVLRVDGQLYVTNDYDEAVPAPLDCVPTRTGVLIDTSNYNSNRHVEMLQQCRREFERPPLEALTDMLQELGSAERTEKRWQRGDIRFQGRETMQPRDVHRLFLELMHENQIPLDWTA